MLKCQTRKCLWKKKNVFTTTKAPKMKLNSSESYSVATVGGLSLFWLKLKTFLRCFMWKNVEKKNIIIFINGKMGNAENFNLNICAPKKNISQSTPEYIYVSIISIVYILIMWLRQTTNKINDLLFAKRNGNKSE